MAAKVSITMSEELYERLGKVRYKFSISGVCQKALEREIRIEELALSSVEEDIIERLKLQKTKLQMDSKQEGRKAGIEDAKEFSYVLLKGYVRFRDLYFYEKEDDYGEDLGDVKGLLEQLALELGYNGPESEGFVDEFFDPFSEDIRDFDFRKYFIGYVAGVVSFYESVKEKIGE